MFWFNLFLFGVLMWLVAAWLWNEDYEIIPGILFVGTTLYSLGYLTCGLIFICHNNIDNLKECIETDNCGYMQLFTHNQAMINSLSSEVQEYFGVEEKFCLGSVIMLGILVGAIIFVILKLADVSYPFANDYKVFNQGDYRTIAIPYKFIIFKKVYESLSISKTNPFISVNKHNLVYVDDTENKRYSLQFSYIDYLRYRYFLRKLFNEKESIYQKRKNKETLEQVLAFNNALQEKLKEEGRRPFKDLVE